MRQPSTPASPRATVAAGVAASGTLLSFFYGFIVPLWIVVAFG